MSAPAQEQDVVDLLLSQHNEVKALFARVKSSTGEAKRDAFQELVRLLAVHESAEEQVVHPEPGTSPREDAPGTQRMGLPPVTGITAPEM